MKVPIKGPIISSDDQWIYDWFGVEATSPKMIDDLLSKSLGEDLEVEINSGGGDVYAGSEIYTALKRYKGNVNIDIVGIAASAASVIAMAGNKVRITPTGQLMIHNVWSIAVGDYRTFEHEAEVLKGHNVGIANAYMLKTGMSQKQLLDLMNKETYFNAQQALKNKFVDEILFNEQNTLVASSKMSVNASGMLPREVIEKMRNQKKDLTGEENREPVGASFEKTQGNQQAVKSNACNTTDVNASDNIKVMAARLNLLKLMEVR